MSRSFTICWQILASIAIGIAIHGCVSFFRAVWHMKVTIGSGGIDLYSGPERSISMLFAWFWYMPYYWGVVPLVAAVLAHALVARPARMRDSESRCRRCQHILRGLTEPRCTECGEEI